MFISLNNQELSTAELITGKISENNLSAFEIEALKFILIWLGTPDSINQQTSGSTGIPKQIKLTRAQVRYSALLTLAHLDTNQSFSSALLVINPEYIGGKMLIVRALESNMSLYVCPPKRLIEFLRSSGQISLVSLVPLQIALILDSAPELFKKFEVVLIGGAALDDNLSKRLELITDVRFYKTYGMSETASHIALNCIGEGSDLFEAVGDVLLRVDDRNCLKIRGTVTQGQWIQTNDIVDLVDDRRFRWVGRADFVINSGGVKVSPEQVEKLLSDQMESPFFIAGLPDLKLGEKVVLIVETNDTGEIALDFDCLEEYHKPKEIFKLKAFDYTASGKINRTLTLQKIQR